MSVKATIRRRLEKIPGVTGTWFEWMSAGHPDDKLLVVEVDFDTDPNAPSFQRDVIEAIYEMMRGAVEEEIRPGAEAPNFIAGLRVVPRRLQQY